MKVIDVLRLLRKHLVLLLLTPIVLVVLVTFLTRKPSFTYSSETILYTGIASGTSVEMDKTLSFFATNTAFDNLINVIKSRETQQEVAIRLLAEHLMMQKWEPRYISKESFINLKKTTPEYIKAFVAHSQKKLRNDKNLIKPIAPTTDSQAKAGTIQKPIAVVHIVKEHETLFSISQQYGVSPEQIRETNTIKGNNLETGQKLRIFKKISTNTDSLPVDSVSKGEVSGGSFSFSTLAAESLNASSLPSSINRDDYEQTVQNLTTYMESNDTNFVYKLLYFKDKHYSVDAISSASVSRISNSDLVKIKYDSDDPGICQQTLALLTEVCIKNYKEIKENRSDAVVKYFEYQLKQASGRLKIGEDKLLNFNEDNNIINYYEQSKAVAVVKEDLDVDYNNKRIKLAGLNASIKRIEEKLGNQKQVQLRSSTILEKRNQLSELNSKIATAETIEFGKEVDDNQLAKLKMAAEKLKDEIRTAVNDLYSYNNSTDGLPIGSLLNDWITNVIEYENIKAGIDVLGERIKEFQKQYAIYAPAGANLKRIEREISVSEQEFLEILHGLNLAKLKMQDAELASTIKAVDPPFFPLSPNPTKRKILIIVGGLLGFLIVLISILSAEYFDDTLKNPVKAAKKLKLRIIGVFPKIFLRTGSINFPFIANRLLEMAIQQIEMLTVKKEGAIEPRTLVFMSSLSDEGKTVNAGSIAWKLKKQGKKVIFLSFSRESLHQNEINQIGYPSSTSQSSSSTAKPRGAYGIFRFIPRLLGYPDTRINPDSPFLQKPEIYLDSLEYFIYEVDNNYFKAGNFRDLIADRFNTAFFDKPDYVLIELPPFLYYSYPQQLVANADLAIVVCRANREWSHADQGAFDVLKKITSQEPVVLLNGIELLVIESVLGDLPKKRSWFRRTAKKIIRLQFYSRYKH